MVAVCRYYARTVVTLHKEDPGGEVGMPEYDVGEDVCAKIEKQCCCRKEALEECRKIDRRGESWGNESEDWAVVGCC